MRTIFSNPEFTALIRQSFSPISLMLFCFSFSIMFSILRSLQSRTTKIH